MTLKSLTVVWIIITVWLFYEYLGAHGYYQHRGFLDGLQCFLSDDCGRFDPRPGRPVSYFFGWLGFGVMALTNVYIIRKRWHVLQKVGQLQRWLDWHIFFGLMGPTLVLFHCDFQVSGLVSISFWSMVISFASGIVGRYFYLQLLHQKSSLKSALEGYEVGFDNYIKMSSRGLSEGDLNQAKAVAFYQATGGVTAAQLKNIGLLEFVVRATKGEINTQLRLPETPWGGGRPIRLKLREWAILKRKMIFMHYYKILFGYWRTFHTPFAVFMYIVAIIHIISSLIFKVH
ncbi:MAG: hypothetical protein HRU19_24160 [Pseudobacteriovorax sp.]|nr:hypothetical protein [Pseudobacteriovorax sp.]